MNRYLSDMRIIVAAGFSKILTKEGKPAGCRVSFLRQDLRRRPVTTLNTLHVIARNSCTPTARMSDVAISLLFSPGPPCRKQQHFMLCRVLIPQRRDCDLTLLFNDCGPESKLTINTLSISKFHPQNHPYHLLKHGQKYRRIFTPVTSDPTKIYTTTPITRCAAYISKCSVIATTTTAYKRFLKKVVGEITQK